MYYLTISRRFLLSNIPFLDLKKWRVRFSIETFIENDCRIKKIQSLNLKKEMKFFICDPYVYNGMNNGKKDLTIWKIISSKYMCSFCYTKNKEKRKKKKRKSSNTFHPFIISDYQSVQRRLVGVSTSSTIRFVPLFLFNTYTIPFSVGKTTATHLTSHDDC